MLTHRKKHLSVLTSPASVLNLQVYSFVKHFICTEQFFPCRKGFILHQYQLVVESDLADFITLKKKKTSMNLLVIGSDCLIQQHGQKGTLKTLSEKNV